MYVLYYGMLRCREVGRIALKGYENMCGGRDISLAPALAPALTDCHFCCASLLFLVMSRSLVSRVFSLSRSLVFLSVVPVFFVRLVSLSALLSPLLLLFVSRSYCLFDARFAFLVHVTFFLFVLLDLSIRSFNDCLIFSFLFPFGSSPFPYFGFPPYSMETFIYVVPL